MGCCPISFGSWRVKEMVYVVGDLLQDGAVRKVNGCSLEMGERVSQLDKGGFQRSAFPAGDNSLLAKRIDDHR